MVEIRDVEPSDVIIRDVCPRDGLQGELPRPVEVRVELARALAACGVPHVEVAAFVSPKAVPAMAGAADVVAGLPSGGSTTYWALVPNVRGAEMAAASGIAHITVTVSASPVYSQRNVGMSIEDSIGQVASIRRLDGSLTIDAVVSCAFGSSFADPITPEGVARICDALRSAGVDQITLADTTGTATPRRIEAVLRETGTNVGLHLHDTRATALTNAYAAYHLGIRRFDTAVGGLGGSPFAAGAGGNLATEDLVLLFEDLGVTTGIGLEGLLGVAARLRVDLGRELPSRVSRAGALPPFA